MIDEVSKVFRKFIKLSFKRKSENYLKLKENIPSIVLEGDSSSKEISIYHSPYLYKMYDRLDNFKGLFVIYGCSIIKDKEEGRNAKKDKGDENELNNDRHIWRRVFKNSDKKKIYIGIHIKNNTVDVEEKYKKKCEDVKEVLMKELSLTEEQFSDYDKDDKQISFYVLTKEDDMWSSDSG